MATDTQTYVKDMDGMTLRLEAIETALMTLTDVVTTTLTATGAITLTGPITIDLTNVPTYADQAAGATALAAGRVFRINTTGALAVALT
jgi:hypothetical protein